MWSGCWDFLLTAQRLAFIGFVSSKKTFLAARAVSTSAWNGCTPVGIVSSLDRAKQVFDTEFVTERYGRSLGFPGNARRGSQRGNRGDWRSPFLQWIDHSDNDSIPWIYHAATLADSSESAWSLASTSQCPKGYDSPSTWDRAYTRPDGSEPQGSFSLGFLPDPTYLEVWFRSFIVIGHNSMNLCKISPLAGIALKKSLSLCEHLGPCSCQGPNSSQRNDSIYGSVVWTRIIPHFHNNPAFHTQNKTYTLCNHTPIKRFIR